MSSSPRFSQTYLKFLNLVQAIRELPTFPPMDAVEERLLNMFAAVWHTGRQITVLQAMELLPDVSPSTIHRRLKTLRQKNMIELNADATDSRIKYVVPSTLADQYFTRMGECLDKARS